MSTGIELARAFITVRGDTTKLPGDLNQAKRIFNATLGSLGAGLSFGYLIQQGRIAIAEYTKLANAQARLRAVLRGTGNVAGFTSEKLEGMAKSLSDMSQFDGAEIINAMAALVPYGIKNEEMFQRIMKAAIDVTTIYGGSLRMSVQAFAQALSDPIRGLGLLSRQGFKFSEQQRKMIKDFMKTNDIAKAQGVIWDVVSGQEGAAAEVAGSHAGQIARQSKIIGDLREELGKRLLPIQGMVVRGQIAWQRVLNATIGPLGSTIIALDSMNTALGGFPVFIVGAAVGLRSLIMAGSALSVLLETKLVIGILRYTHITRLATVVTNAWTKANFLLILSLNKMNLNGAALLKWLVRSPVMIMAFIVAIAALAYGVYRYIKWASQAPATQAAWARSTVKLKEGWGEFGRAFGRIWEGMGEVTLSYINGALKMFGVKVKDLPKSMDEATAMMLDNMSTFVAEMGVASNIMIDDWEVTWEVISNTATIWISRMQMNFTNFLVKMGAALEQLGPLGTLGLGGVAGGLLAGLGPDLQNEVDALKKKIDDLNKSNDEATLRMGKYTPPGANGGDNGNDGPKPPPAAGGGGGDGMKAGRYGFEEFGKTIQDSLLGKKDKVPMLLEGVIDAVEGVEEAIEDGADAADGAAVGGGAAAGGLGAGVGIAGGEPGAHDPPWLKARKARREAELAGRGGDLAADAGDRAQKQAARLRQGRSLDDIKAEALRNREEREANNAFHHQRQGTTPGGAAVNSNPKGYRTVRPGGGTPTQWGSGIPQAPNANAMDNTILGLYQGQSNDLQRKRENDMIRSQRNNEIYAPYEEKLKKQLSEIRGGVNPEATGDAADKEIVKLLQEANRRTDVLITTVKEKTEGGLL